MTEAVLEALGGGAAAAPEQAAEAVVGSSGSACPSGQSEESPAAGRAEGASDPARGPAREEGEEGAPAGRGAAPAADAIRAHFASLVAQGEALRAEFPDFDLAEALRDPAFLRLTAPALGVGVREAWTALHPEALDARAARRAARDAETLLVRAASQGALRPREGGGLEAAALTRRDCRGLSRGERERLKDRIREAAARGEKVYP